MPLNNFISFLQKQSCNHKLPCLARFKGQSFLTMNQETILCFLWKICLGNLSWPWDVFEVELMCKLSLGTPSSKKESFVRNFHYLNCLIRVLTFLTSYSLAVERALVSLFQLEQKEGPVAWGHFNNKPCPQELEKNNSFLLKSYKTIFSY